MLRFLIADDYDVMRKGIRLILQEGFGSVYIEEASDTHELINKASSGKWDMVLTDLNMPGGGGLNALRFIKENMPDLPVLVISIYPAEQYTNYVMKAGAKGYVCKSTAPDELIKTVRDILTGKTLTPNIAEKV